MCIAYTNILIKLFTLSCNNQVIIIGNRLILSPKNVNTILENIIFWIIKEYRICCYILWIYCVKINSYAFIISLHFLFWFVHFIIEPYTSSWLDIEDIIWNVKSTHKHTPFRYLYILRWIVRRLNYSVLYCWSF